MKESEMLSSAHVNPALTRTINNSILDKIRVVGKENGKWHKQGRELVRMRESSKKIPNEWNQKMDYYITKSNCTSPKTNLSRQR